MNQSLFSFMSVHSKERDGENCWEKQKSKRQPEGQKEREWTEKQRQEDVRHGNLFLKINQTYTSSNPEAPQADQDPLC